MKTGWRWVWVAGLAIGLLAPAAFADEVILTARGVGGVLTGNPPYREIVGNWQNSSIRSSQDPAGTGSRFATVAGAAFSWSPQTLVTAGGIYRVQITHPDATSNHSLDVVMDVAVTNGTMRSGPGVADPVVTSTTVFQRAGNNTWETVGYVHLDTGQTVPTVTFTATAAYTLRLYSDGIKFTDFADLGCTVGLAEIPATRGPLSAGQTGVVVPGVDGSATAVTVYSIDTSNNNSTQIGQLTTGIVAGDNTVPVTGLIKGRKIIATQTNASNVESCKPSNGNIVGGGTNPRVRVALCVREDATLTGPIGTPGASASGTVAFLGGTNVAGGFGTAPVCTGNAECAKFVLEPGQCWKTVSFLRGADPNTPRDPVWEWAGPNDQKLLGDFGLLDSLGIALDNNDNGAYLIYIDEVMNGNVLIQGWETGTGTILFNQPSFSGTTNVFLMPVSGIASPNSAVVSTDYADRGTKSYAINWQFKDLNASDWLRLASDAPAQGAKPMIDLRLPISFRLLLLPVNAATPNVPLPPGAAPTISQQPANQISGIGGQATFTVVADSNPSGGSLSYQWLKNGAPLVDTLGLVEGATTATLTLKNLQLSENGANGLGALISVTLCDGDASAHSNDAVLTVTPCGVPFADDDHDGDVDQLDFARLQECFSGAGNPITGAGCTCFDVKNADGGGGYLNADSDVDADDLAEFIKCVSGPEVPYVEAEHPTCEGWMP